jgi:hypothetical protein
MKTLTMILLSAAVLAVGLFAGTVAYQASSAAPDSGSTAAAAAPATPVVHRQHRAKPKVRWAPCKPPAKLQGKACVTEEVRTVVVSAPAPAPAPVAAPARSVRATHAEPAEHEQEHAEHEHESEHESEHEHESGDD